MSLEMSFCMQLGSNESIGPEFAASLVGQESPVDILGNQYPGRIVNAVEVKTTDGRVAFEVTVQFEGPSGLFKNTMIGLSNA